MAIVVSSVKDLYNFEYDEVWAIMRSYDGTRGYRHVPQLAPSWNLFRLFLSLRDSGNWNRETFEQIYVPQFIAEMSSTTAQKAIDELLEESKHRIIAVACTCADETTCHRSVVGGICTYRGADVYGLRADYSGYARMLYE